MFFNLFSTATAHIKGSTKYPRIDGIVAFKETKEGVLLTAKINHLPHSKTNFNPTNCPHPFYVRDLPPLLENNSNEKRFVAHITNLFY